jgi:hypothetical protein
VLVLVDNTDDEMEERNVACNLYAWSRLCAVLQWSLKLHLEGGGSAENKNQNLADKLTRNKGMIL